MNMQRSASPSELERTWRGYALRLIGQRNFALWLDYFVPLFSGLTLACAIIVLALRSLGGPAHLALYSLPVLVLLGMGGICLFLWKRFDDTFDGLVQLDINQRLHNRLTSAHYGVGPWPNLPGRVNFNVKWRWERILPPVLCSIAFLWAAQAIKVTPNNPFRPKPTQQPIAWTQTDTWLETLKEEKLVDEKTLDEFEAKLGELKKDNAQDWYSHGSLEAGDNIKRDMEKGMLDLQQYLKQAQDILESARAAEGKMSEATLEKVEAQYAEAMKGLENGALPLDQGMMNELKTADPKAMSQMSKEQYNQMMQRMQSGQQKLSESLGNNGGQGQQGNGMAEMKSGKGQGQGKKKRHTVEGEEEGEGEGSGEGEGQGDGKEGEGPGKGGISRGRGDAPLTFEDEESHIGGTKDETLKSNNFERAMPGDLMGLSKTSPEVDPAKLGGPQGGGDLMSSGKGGEAVWRDTLTPEEREFLGKINQ
jgi:hypothetical protein